MENLEQYKQQFIELVQFYGLKLLTALLILVIGLWVIKRITNMVGKSFQKQDIDPSLQPFLLSMISVILKVLLGISVLSTLGIEMTSFVAILGAAGLAVGMALSGTLQNFAGGVMILIFKPFKVGDVIEAQGYTGSVKAIQIFVTIMTTPDNKTIILPNGQLSNSAMVNYSTEPKRRVDMVFGIGYTDDIDKARGVISSLIAADNRIINEPAAPAILVGELADSSVNFKVRVWCNAADYWGIYFDMHENVKKSFDKEGVSIPFPQMDVHLNK